jgi:transcriptional regulator with XRE-family HTH domain
MTFSERLRDQLTQCGVSRYEIAKRSQGCLSQSHLSQSHLSQFMQGKRGLSLRKLDVLVSIIERAVSSRQ